MLEKAGRVGAVGSIWAGQLAAVLADDLCVSRRVRMGTGQLTAVLRRGS